MSKAFGVPCTTTFIKEHRESISCCYIEAGRAGVRLAPTVALPPLAGAPDAPVPEAVATPPETGPAEAPPDPPEAGEIICGMTPDPALEPSTPTPTTNGHAPPLVVPTDAGLPCGRVAIVALKPAQLAMLIGKVARLVHDQGEAWIGLLAALQGERARRLERGRKPIRPGSEEKG